MIHCLPITTAHDTLVDKIQHSTPQIITCKDPILYCRPHKEGNMPRSLNLPNTFLRKNNGQGASQLIVKRLDIKIPILCQLPSHSISVLSNAWWFHPILLLVLQSEIFLWSTNVQFLCSSFIRMMKVTVHST